MNLIFILLLILIITVCYFFNRNVKKKGTNEESTEIIGETYAWHHWTFFVGPKPPADYKDTDEKYFNEETPIKFDKDGKYKLLGMIINKIMTKDGVNKNYCYKLANNIRAELKFIVIEPEVYDKMVSLKDNKLFTYIEGKKYVKTDEFYGLSTGNLQLVITTDLSNLYRGYFINPNKLKDIDLRDYRKKNNDIDKLIDTTNKVEDKNFQLFLKEIIHNYFNFERKLFITSAEFLKQYLNLGFIKNLYYFEEKNITFYGVVFAAISDHFLIFGENHDEWKKTYINEPLIGNNYPNELDFYFYLKKVGKKAVSENYEVNLFIEGNVDEAVDWIKKYYPEFKFGVNNNLTFKYIDHNLVPDNLYRYIINLLLSPIKGLNIGFLDIREYENDHIAEKLFEKYGEGLIFSFDFFKENICLKEEISEIEKCFSREFLKIDTDYKNYMSNHPFMSRTAYEFFKLQEKEPKIYNKVIDCLKYVYKNENVAGDYLAVYTDFYIIGRLLRHPKAYNIFYSGAAHSANYVKILEQCSGINKFKLYTNGKKKLTRIGEIIDTLNNYTMSSDNYLKFDNNKELFFEKSDTTETNTIDFSMHSLCNIL